MRTYASLLVLVLSTSLMFSIMPPDKTSGTHLTQPLVGVWSDTYKSSIIADENLGPGLTFAVSVNVTEVTDLTTYSITLRYFSDALTTSDANVQLDTVEGKEFQEIGREVNDATGTITIIAGLGGDVVTVPVSAKLFSVLFTVDRIGSTFLSLTTVRLGVVVDGFPQPITPTIEDGSFSNTGNRPPVASFKFNWTDIFPDAVVTQGETVTYNASASFDPDALPGAPNNGIVRYEWDFGDGTTTAVETDPVISHVFQQSLSGQPRYGSFTVTLTVFDDPNETGSKDRESTLITVARAPSHNLAVVEVLANPPNQARQGDSVSITVTVLNKGTFLENFTLTVFAESIEVARDSIENLSPDQSVSKSYVWNTAGMSAAVYRIKANVTIAAGETATADNSLTIIYTLTSERGGSSTLFLVSGAVVAGGALVGVLAYLLRRRAAKPT